MSVNLLWFILKGNDSFLVIFLLFEASMSNLEEIKRAIFTKKTEKIWEKQFKIDNDQRIDLKIDKKND